MDTEKLCLGCLNEKGDDAVCPHCGYDPTLEPESPIYLPPGTILNNKYLLGRVLGHGGFGITYLAWDMDLELKVAVKEYLPDGLATRSADHVTITRYTGDKARHFDYGLQKFLDEARTLARFHDHPGIVAVMYVFEENDTAYFVMSYLEGTTLKGYLKKHGGRINYSLARDIIMPVLDALRVVHERGLLHRDISPDNIFITKTGQVKLLDFGAARYSMGEQSRSLSVILKPGYAPEEQYRSKGKQGPWTDVYATAATMYRAITGLRPDEALDRLEEDELKLPSELGAAIPSDHEAALMTALSVKAENRYQNVDEFQQYLLSGADAQAVPGMEPLTGVPPTPPDAFNEGAEQDTVVLHEMTHAVPPPPDDMDLTRPPAAPPADMPTPPTQGVISSADEEPAENPYSAIGLPPETRKKGFPWLATFLILLLLAVIGGGAWAYFQHPEWFTSSQGPIKHPSDPINMSELHMLTIDTKPAGAYVELPGSGFTYYPGMALEPGDYTVRVTMDGYQPVERIVTIGAEDVSLSINLNALSANQVNDGDLFVDPVTGMEFVRVYGGCYEMGCGGWSSDCDDDEHPTHMVCVDDFWMGRYEVTQAQYEAVTNDNPSRSGIGPDYPVDNVSYDMAVSYAEQLGSRNNYQYMFRLPTEAEWEYACRDMGQHQNFSGGYDHWDVSQSRDQNISSSRPVGLLLPNSLGIHDMSGNLWEWVQDQDITDAYQVHNRYNPALLSGGENNIVRGGSWADTAMDTRCGERGSWPPQSGDSDLGFRLIRLP